MRPVPTPFFPPLQTSKWNLPRCVGVREGLTLVVLVGAALVAAGCLADKPQAPDEPPGEVASVLCRDVNGEAVCNFEATLYPATRQANELSIAVNPTNPLNIIASGKDYTPDYAGDCVWDGVYTTFDGGLTWINQNIPGSPWYLQVDPTGPINDFTKFWCATDPVLAFDDEGTAYWTVMPYQCDRVSGSKTGRDVLPQGGFNDWFWTCSSMYVLVSHDGGETWPEYYEVAFGPRLEHDKQWMAAAPNGNVLLCWDRSTDYLDTGSAADQLSASENHMLCSVGTNKGTQWTEPVALNPDWPGIIPAVDYGPDNTAYAVYIDDDSVLVSKSRDGLNWERPTEVAPYALPEPGGEYGWPVLRGSAFRVLNIPLIAVDRSDGPYSGSIYVTWFDHARGEGDVYVAYSRDQGATWSQPMMVHDDNSTHDQFYPAISVGPNGTVDVSWWDRRDDPDNHLFHVYYTYSKDGGKTWAPNLRVTDVASDEQYSHHQNGMIFLGDYRDQDSSELGAHLVWVDTRNGIADVYVATVER